MKNIFRKIFVLVGLFMPMLFAAQKIYTVAGTGTLGYSGDGGLATQAQLNRPNSIAFAAAGNMYIADQSNYRIRKVNTSGQISTIAGDGITGFAGDGGPAVSARISSPSGVAVDNTGNVFFCDQQNSRIRKINTAGVITTVAGNGQFAFSGDGFQASLAQLFSPRNVIIDPNGNILFVDYGNGRIRKITTSGIIYTVAGGGTLTTEGVQATSALLDNVNGIAADGSGNIYLSESDKNRVRKIDALGVINTIAGTGIAGASGNGGPALNAQFDFPSGLSVLNNEIYVTEWGNHWVRKINSTGIVTVIAGTGSPGISTDGTTATAAAFHSPDAVVATAGGNVYIVDWAHNKVWMMCENNCLFTAIEENRSEQKIQVYPNPAANTLYVGLDESCEKCKFTIIDALGRKVFEQEAVLGLNSIDLNFWAKGLYSFVSTGANGIISTSKFSIE